MNLFFLFLGVAVLALLIFGSYLLHRRITGEGSPLFGDKREPKRGGTSDLEAFIAAYRAGKVSPEQLKSDSVAPLALAAGQTAPVAPLVAESPVFLRPEVKLAYLTFRAGLRDHHVFVNVRLADLAREAGDARVDLLLMDAKFVPVAAVDVHRPGEHPQPDKAPALRAAGVRYLRLQSTAMPKPADVSALIYRT